MLLLLFALWILLNGRITLEIVCFGVGITGALFLFTVHFMGYSLEREGKAYRTAPLLLAYLANLLWETLKAAADVLRIALNPSQHPEPVLVEFRSGLKKEYQNVILANSITLTPGTITVFQEKDRFVVHALRREYAQGLDRSSFVRLLRKFP